MHHSEDAHVARRTQTSLLDLFIVTAPGLAPLCAEEVRGNALLAGLQSPQVETGGIAVRGDLTALYSANLHLRTASRILVRLGGFHAENFGQLQARAALLDWGRYLRPGSAVDVRVTSHKSRLYHTGAVAERVVNAIGDYFGQLPPCHKHDEEGDEPGAQLVVVRLLYDTCTISIDASGALLHRRGYRLATAKAPLRETLAAGLLLASGWNAVEPPPLLDPFCGSGTIPIEAAMLALQLAPGRNRRFAFMDWPGFAAATWQMLLERADAHAQARRAQLGDSLVVQASDRDAGAIEAARSNAQRAGVADVITFTCRAISAIEPPTATGHIVTNPPYGQRVRSGGDLRNLYAQIGNVLRMRCSGWHVTLLSTDRVLLGQTNLRLDTSLTFVNGGMNVIAARGVVG
jgi:putative N6-adenine-specific DNA methylase